MLNFFEDFIREIAAHLGSARNDTGTADQYDGPMPQAEVLEPKSAATQAEPQTPPTFYLLTGQFEAGATLVAELVEERPSGRTHLRFEAHRRAALQIRAAKASWSAGRGPSP
jgi:hypothetical protein